MTKDFYDRISDYKGHKFAYIKQLLDYEEVESEDQSLVLVDSAIASSADLMDELADHLNMYHEGAELITLYDRHENPIMINGLHACLYIQRWG